MNKITGIVLLLLFICLGTALINERFVSPGNMENNVRWSASFGIIGIGVAFVIITGGIDLSIGSVIGLIGCLLAMLLTRFGWPVWLSLLAVMAASALVGLYHGLLITKIPMQPFIVTLAGLMYFRGFARLVTGDRPQGFGNAYDDSLRLLATGRPCSVALLLAVAGVALAAWSALRLRSSNSTSAGTDRSHRAASFVCLAIGAVLIGVGSSRFWHGWEVTRGQPLMTIAGLDIPTWSAAVPDAAATLPATAMRWCGWGLVPGLAWLAWTLIQSGKLRRVLAPTVLIAAGAGLVIYAQQIVAAENSWFWPDASWAKYWRILAVFGSLGILLGAVSWLLRRAEAAAGAAIRPPVILIFASAGLWLLGETPLGQMLVPAPMVFLIVLAVLSSIFLNQTIYGRYLLALGRNEEAARYSGINTDRMIILAYVLCGLFTGIGGILFALDLNSIQPQGHGNTYELYAIAAAVLGGCSLRGGEGTITGVIVGAAVMQVLRNSIEFLGIPRTSEYVIIGFVILLGVLADETFKRMAARRKPAVE